jgi:hypothetical protein
MMQNENYVTFEISGVKHTGHKNSVVFNKDAICEINNDQFIKRIIVTADISSATFYLNDSISFTDETTSQIVSYLHKFLGSMMISLLKNSSQYSNVSLMPAIRLSSYNFIGRNMAELVINDYISLSDSLSIQCILGDGNDILYKWIRDADVSRYSNKKDRYDVLFLLLQGQNPVQKYMAIYAYLMSLVREINSTPNEGQKQVVKYVTDNCSRVGITLHLSPSTRPGARPGDNEDQFTTLRNKIGHPNVQNGLANISESAINGLTSFVCCAIEDVAN